MVYSSVGSEKLLYGSSPNGLAFRFKPEGRNQTSDKAEGLASYEQLNRKNIEKYRDICYNDSKSKTFHPSTYRGVRNMKKTFIICLLIVAFLLAPMTSCTQNSTSVDNCCTEVISLMSQMLSCDEYSKIYHLPEEYNGTITKMKEGNYVSPSAIYKLVIPEDALLMDELDIEKLPDELKDYARAAMYVGFASKININAGSESVAISSVFCAQKTFVCSDIKESTVFLYVFEKGAPIALTVLPGESGSVRVSGYFIISDLFETGDAKQIEAACEALGIGGVVAEKE